MRDQHIIRLEAQLEDLVEGAFARLFGKKLRVHDLALKLARAMQDNVAAGTPGTTRLSAPDHYVITVSPLAYARLLREKPALPEHLQGFLVELTTNAGYELKHPLVVCLRAEEGVGESELILNVSHSVDKDNRTTVMQPVKQPAALPPPRYAQLVLNGQQLLPLQLAVINIGRSQENEIVLDDPKISRSHAQLRLRAGRYILFDAESRGGVYVNDVRVKEHILQSGDVVRMGRTRLIYTENNPQDGDTPGWVTTVDFDSERDL